MENRNQKKSQQILLRSLKESIEKLNLNKKLLLIEENSTLYFGKHKIKRIHNNIFFLFTDYKIYEVCGIDSAIVISYFIQHNDYKKLNEIRNITEQIYKRHNEYLLYLEKCKIKNSIDNITKMENAKHLYEQCSFKIKKYAIAILR